MPDLQAGQKLIFPIDRPIKSSGHIQIMYGNLAPEGCVGKITGKEGLDFEGPARVFDNEEAMLKAVDAGPQTFKVHLLTVITGHSTSDITSGTSQMFVVCYSSLFPEWLHKHDVLTALGLGEHP